MGVRHLLRTHQVVSSSRRIALSTLPPSSVCVDTSIFIRRVLYSLPVEESLRLHELRERVGTAVKRLRKFGHTPMFAFDGPTREKEEKWKARERLRRRLVLEKQKCSFDVETERLNLMEQRYSQISSKLARDKETKESLLMTDDERSAKLEHTLDEEAVEEMETPTTVEATLKGKKGKKEKLSHKLIMQKEVDSIPSVHLSAHIDQQRELLNRRMKQLRVTVPTKREFQVLKEELTSLKVPSFMAHGEADFAIASLHKLKLIDVYLGSDSDMLMYGVDMIRAVDFKDLILNVDEPIKTEDHTLYSYREILRSFDLTPELFKQYCWLLGCDYSAPPAAGLGPVRSLELIKRHGSIDAIIDILIGHAEKSIALHEHLKGSRTKLASRLKRLHNSVFEAHQFKAEFNEMYPMIQAKIEKFNPKESIDWIFQGAF